MILGEEKGKLCRVKLTIIQIKLLSWIFCNTSFFWIELVLVMIMSKAEEHFLSGRWVDYKNTFIFML